MANNLPTIKPSLNLQFANTNAIPPDVTFTRASTSGGYYDDRTVSKAEENLILQSQTFDDAAWTKTAVTISANSTAAPDGTATADTVTGSAGTTLKAVFPAAANTGLASAVVTFSIFAKEGTHRYIQISINGDATKYVNFDLNGSGATSAFGSGVTSSVTVAANGFIRCVVSLTGHPNTSRFYVSLQDSLAAAREATTTSTGDIFLWGAQTELRASVTAYTPTTTAPITNYIPKMLFAATNVPVIDHNPTTGERLGLAIWEARTNLLTYSEDFSNAAWTKTNSTISANQIIAPDGTLTVDNFIPNSGSAVGSSILERTVTAAAAAYTESIFVKGAGFNSVILNFRDNASVSNQASVTFDISAATISTAASVQGSFTSPVATITDVGNGWRRISLTCTTTGAAAFRVRLWQAVSAGDGYSGIYIWGAQLEAGAFATPYIPTVASTVARSADVAVMTGVNFSRWFNAGEGSFVANALTANTAATGGIFSAEDNTANNRMQLRNNSSGVMSFTSVITGTAEVGLTNGSFAANVYKIGSATYKVNDYAASCDGAAVSTDTIARVPIVDRLVIGSGTSQNWMNGYIKSLSYYPARLTNAQLQAVTA